MAVVDTFTYLLPIVVSRAMNTDGNPASVQFISAGMSAVAMTTSSQAVNEQLIAAMLDAVKVSDVAVQNSIIPVCYFAWETGH